VAEYDAVVVGSGPNGLTAACVLASAGLSVLVVEAAPDLGGGLRSAELTLPGFTHDVCAAVHTLGCLSPVFHALDLETHGLRWVYPDASVAHPLEGAEAVIAYPDIERTVAQLAQDGGAYRGMLEPLLRAGEGLMGDVLSPLRFPRHPVAMARLGFYGFRSVEALANGRFHGARARALLAGCAAHSVLPLDRYLTAGVSLVFLLAAHMRPWPVAEGGSRSIANALCEAARSEGVSFETNVRIERFDQLPSARAVLFDLAPRQVATIAADQLPARYLRALTRYRMGPGVFKVDWALDGEIPWSARECRLASTVHVGGTIDEVARSENDAFEGRRSDRPFVLVAQQSHFDATRAPSGRHTGYGYCHVPAGFDGDMTDAIEAQVERFAPGFRDRILARHVRGPAQWERYNPSYVGGAITGGVADLKGFVARPALRLDPYSTPNRRLYMCSHSTPPGGGVHGMCGLHAARSALRRVFGLGLGGLGKRLAQPHDCQIGLVSRRS